MYARIKVEDGNGEFSIGICSNTGGTVDVLRDVYCATGCSIGGRILNVGCYWGFWKAETRSNDTTGIDDGRQSKEEYGSGRVFRKHLDNDKERMDERMVLAESARERD